MTRRFIDSHPRDSSRVLEVFSSADILTFLKTLSADHAARLLEPLGSPAAVQVLSGMDTARAAEILGKMSLPGVAALLRRVGEGRRRELLESLPRTMSWSLKALLVFPENTAGGIMDPEFLSLRRDLSVDEAVRSLKGHPEAASESLYLVDDGGRLAGRIALHRLLARKGRDPLESLLTSQTPAVPAGLTLGAVLDHPGWRDHHELPVIDEGSRIVGVLRYGILRDLERRGRQGVRSALETALGLGEVFWEGFAAALQILTAILRPREDSTRR